MNLTILTSKQDEIIEKLIQYFKLSKLYLTGIISNDINLENKYRKHKINIYNTNQYKEIDRIISESKSEYIILVEYNEQLPPNFMKKYHNKIFNVIKNNNEIIIYYFNTNSGDDDIIFRINGDDLDDLIYRYYPIVIEKELNKRKQND